MAFSISGAAIFAAMTARAVDQRLRLAGHSPLELLLGRLLVLVLLAFAVAGIFAVVIAATSRISDFWALAGALVLVAVIGVPFGLAVGALAPRELEAVLVMVGVVGVQLSLIGMELVAKLLPFWGPHRLLNLSTGDRLAALEPALAGAGWHRVAARGGAPHGLAPTDRRAPPIGEAAHHRHRQHERGAGLMTGMPQRPGWPASQSERRSSSSRSSVNRSEGGGA